MNLSGILRSGCRPGPSLQKPFPGAQTLKSTEIFPQVVTEGGRTDLIPAGRAVLWEG